MDVTPAVGALLVDRTVFVGATGGTASIVSAEVTRIVTINVRRTRDGFPYTAHVSGRSSNKVLRTGTANAVIDYIAKCIGTAGGTALARVHALTPRTDQVFAALAVRSTADLATVLTAYFVVLAFVVVSAEK